MGRYTGPKHRLARKLGVNVLDKTSASLSRRLNVPPGVQGRRRKKRLSEFGMQMQEKQKAKYAYGLLERQFKNLVKSVRRKKGDTQEMIIALLETRLDNVIYRLGFAKTRFMARQLVSHRHVLVNGRRINIPSSHVKIDDIITLSPKLAKNPQVLESLKEEKNILPFLKRQGLSGKLIRMPKREEVNVPFDLRPIIEYYSR